MIVSAVWTTSLLAIGFSQDELVANLFIIRLCWLRSMLAVFAVVPTIVDPLAGRTPTYLINNDRTDYPAGGPVRTACLTANCWGGKQSLQALCSELAILRSPFVCDTSLLDNEGSNQGSCHQLFFICRRGQLHHEQAHPEGLFNRVLSQITPLYLWTEHTCGKTPTARQVAAFAMHVVAGEICTGSMNFCTGCMKEMSLQDFRQHVFMPLLCRSHAAVPWKHCLCSAEVRNLCRP